MTFPVPCILACGYHEITSLKRNLTFPAWLVQLSDGNCRWRAKRDFLLLFRASTNAAPPKAALQKLTLQAPWRVPGYTGNGERRFVREEWAERKVVITETEGMDETGIGNREAGSDEFPDNYQVWMKKSIHQLDEFLQRVSVNRDPSVLAAWEVFNRPEDTKGLLPTSTTTLTQSREDKSSETARSSCHRDGIKQSSQWGQYFCSPSTARQVVELTLQYAMCRKKTHITFLEPSCGHGDILWTLIEQLKQEQDLDYNIIAYDIDSSAVERCRTHALQRFVTEWRVGDFLRTTPSLPAPEKNSLLLVLGGPPYTSGAGALMDRNLPQAFLQHCTKVWKADFVAFILPDRYRAKPLSVNTEEASQSAENGSGEWKVETHELDSSTFYFQGVQKVSQPSIIQCYYFPKQGNGER